MRKIKATNIVILIATITTITSCKKKIRRDFFEGMTDTAIDIKIDSNNYFVRSFKLSAEAIVNGNKAYWKLDDNEKSYFYLEGYLRKQYDSVMIIPIGVPVAEHENEEYKLFDFSLKHKASWKIIFKTGKLEALGDSITYLNTTILPKDTLYRFKLTPFVFRHSNKYYDYNSGRGSIYLEVSKYNGIETISKYNPINDSIVYQAILYPKLKFVNNGRHNLEL